MIKIHLAKPHGFCGNQQFGVTGSIAKAIDTVRQFPDKTYILGEIVHNQHVVDWLAYEYGIKTVHRLADIPPQSYLIIRSHGAAPQVYKKAKKRKLNIIDATCPLVAKAHQDVRNFAEQGMTIIYICSQPDHDEAIGVYGEAPQSITLLTLKDLENLKIADPTQTVVITQTTLSILETKTVLDNLQLKYPEITIKPHICLATTERQQAIINLAKKIGFVIIVGSPTSSNSNRLKEVAESAGARTYIVDNANQLKKSWFKNKKEVAVSSGASTPEWVLEEVIEKIKTF